MNRSLNDLAKQLRKKSTDTEMFLWKFLRNRQLNGFKFRRQQPIDYYIVDFVCFEKRLIIEVDGGQHSSEREKDTERDNHLKKNGFRVLRFWNNEVFTNIEGVLEVIKTHYLKSPSPTPPPVKGGGNIRGIHRDA